MTVFSQKDFGKDGVNYLQFDDNFEFDEANKIIFGFNGIGKTSIYNYLKNTQQNNYQFLDYENKPKFTSAKKKFVISTDLSDLDFLCAERDNIKKRLSVKECFKQYGIKSKNNADLLGKEFADFFNRKNSFGMPSIDEGKYKRIATCLQPNEIIELMKNMDEISRVSDITREIKDYSEKYLFNVFDLIEENLDKSSTKCPVCGTENVDVFKYIEKKRNELLSLSESLFGKFNYITSKKKEDQVHALNELIDISKDVTVEILITICISNCNYEEYKNLVESSKKLVEIEKKDFYYRNSKRYILCTNV